MKANMSFYYDFECALSGLRQLLPTERPLKMMKNAFYFTLKAIFVLNIFKFLPWLFGHVENSLIRRIELISKFMTSQPGKQTIAIQILPNISRTIGKQKMKFDQLIEYNTRRDAYFFKNQTQNVV